MRILLGLIAGIAIGAVLGDWGGAVVVGGLGVLLGIGMSRGDAKRPESRIDLLERKVAYLKEHLDKALQRIDKLEAKLGVEGEAPQTFRDDAVGVAAEPFVAPQEPLASEAVAAPLPATEEVAAPVVREAPVEVAEPPAPRPPNWIETGLAGIRDWFLGGNTVVRVGIVILFFGVAFLLKYAYDHSNVPPELRIAGVVLGGAVLLGLGWRLRARKEGFALALQGGGVGVLYLAIFAALKLYHLLPAHLAFGLLFCVAAFSAVLAVLQNAQALAILGASGGFIAPILTSTGEGSHVMLFSYYALLNLGILAIAWFKAWRTLNLTGFLFTFGIGILWGEQRYNVELFASTEPFLILFFAMYLAVSILFALRRAPQLKHYLDGTLIFGLPIVAFGMQVRLVQHLNYGAAISALVLSFIYVLIARVIYARRSDELRALVEAMLALSIVFATLAIPLALDGRWTSSSWALEGAAIVWLGIRQQRLLARLFGMALQVAAAGAFVLSLNHSYVALPLFNSYFLGALFLAVAALFTNWIMQHHAQALRRWESPIALVAFVWGALWWLVAGLSEIGRHLSNIPGANAEMLFVALSCVVFSELHRRLQWSMAKFVVLALLPFAVRLLLEYAGVRGSHPLAAYGWVLWPVVLATHLWLLKKHAEHFDMLQSLLHAAGLWLLAVLGAWELSWWVDHWVGATAVWALVGWMIVPALLVALLSARGERMGWPVGRRLSTYLVMGTLPLVIALGIWLLYSTVDSDGNPSPLPYVPLLNPLDLAQLAALMSAVFWFKSCERNGLLRSEALRPTFFNVLGVVGFICTNGMLLRTLHHWAGVPFDADRMFSSMLVQASLSIFWTVLALCITVIATRLHRRALWFVGAGLMGVVVLKLVLVDLSNGGTVERIVSFLGVGVLMLVVGYFSPVPPKVQERTP